MRGFKRRGALVPWAMALDLEDWNKIDRIVRTAVRDELARAGEGEPVEMAGRWQGGKIQIWPRDPGGAAKELAIDDLFHKIVMIRDRLRVLEQKLNGHGKLTDEEKVDLQQYITRCYGSLTTFNLLFRNREDQFSGATTRKEGDE
jgi:hypothetical protein